MGSYANGIVDVHFLDEQTGFLAGQSAQGSGLAALILGTTDGGQNWTPLATGSHSNQRCWKIQFISDLVGYISIEEFEPTPQYYKTEDGGQTWDLMTLHTTDTAGTMQGIGFLNEGLG